MSTSSDTEFTGKRALVTGGTRGIGEAIVQRLRGAGATVVTTARSTPHDLLQPDLFVEADLSTAEGAETVVRSVRDRLGGVDMLVHNVGGSSAPGRGFAALTDDEWQQALNSNLLAAVRLDRGLLPAMLEQGAGVIIHISSMGGLLRLVVKSKSRYPLCRYKEEPMKTRIQKWGNSLALRIPKSFAAEMHLEQGTLVEVSLHDGKLLVTPLSQPTITLEELLKHVTPQNLHHEVDTGPAVGGEVW